MSRQRIARITLDESAQIRLKPDVAQEREVALYDLIEDNHFAPVGHDGGPYHLRLAIEENRLVLDVREDDDTPVREIRLSLAGFRRLVKDYFVVCDSYFDAIKHRTNAEIEAIDMGRRGLHNEGAEVLIRQLGSRVTIDHDTARRLFTLICVLHIRDHRR